MRPPFVLGLGRSQDSLKSRPFVCAEGFVGKYLPADQSLAGLYDVTMLNTLWGVECVEGTLSGNLNQPNIEFGAYNWM